MNRYVILSRLTGPAMVLLTGVLALLNQARILSWGKSWPLYLITLGVIKLAQRAALPQVETDAYPGYPGYTPPGQYPPAPPAPASTTTAIVPASDSPSDSADWRP